MGDNAAACGFVGAEPEQPNLYFGTVRFIIFGNTTAYRYFINIIKKISHYYEPMHCYKLFSVYGRISESKQCVQGIHLLKQNVDNEVPGMYAKLIIGVAYSGIG